ncbi:MAG: sigma-70 family RNA polymerase sigma factor [Lachnospiraceae bacterium]|nr:sigma-70 family RNA polymerase sigma factor [Lachnospiraceae bacterium]
MYDYSTCTDEELILRLRDGEEAIMDYILNKYKNLVRKYARNMYILGAEEQDLIQEGMIGLFRAIKDYDCGRDASFFTFADLCISRKMYNAIEAAKREKHTPLNNYVSLYSNNDDENKGGKSVLGDLLSAGEISNPENLFIDKENVKQIETLVEKELSSFEKQVFDLYITGMKYVQIAKVLGRDEKSTDNALQRIKSKLKKAMEKD